MPKADVLTPRVTIVVGVWNDQMRLPVVSGTTDGHDAAVITNLSTGVSSAAPSRAARGQKMIRSSFHPENTMQRGRRGVRGVLGLLLVVGPAIALGGCVGGLEGGRSNTRSDRVVEGRTSLDKLPDDVGTKIDINYDNKVTLVGSKVEPAGPVKTGERVKVTMYWKVDKAPRRRRFGSSSRMSSTAPVNASSNIDQRRPAPPHDRP